MKKFSEFKKYKRIYEQDEILGTFSGSTSSIDHQQVVVTIDSSNPSMASQFVQGSNSQNKNSEKSEQPEKSNASKFFSKLFESREMAHIYHLQVKGDSGSFAAHKALNHYYDEVLDLIDTLVETYQGQYEIVEDYEIIDTKETKSKDKIEYFISLAKFIQDNRHVSLLQQDTHLQNIIDEIVALIYQTLYKLKYNR